MSNHIKVTVYIFKRMGYTLLNGSDNPWINITGVLCDIDDCADQQVTTELRSTEFHATTTTVIEELGDPNDFSTNLSDKCKIMCA